MVGALQELIYEAQSLGGGNLCASGHDWQQDGGRSCPKDGWGKDSACSQTVYRCTRCGQHDYGDPGGPAHKECHVECSYVPEPDEVEESAAPSDSVEEGKL